MEPVFVSVKVSKQLPFVPIHWPLRITLRNWTSIVPGFILVVVQTSQQQRQRLSSSVNVSTKKCGGKAWPEATYSPNENKHRYQLKWLDKTTARVCMEGDLGQNSEMDRTLREIGRTSR